MMPRKRTQGSAKKKHVDSSEETKRVRRDIRLGRNLYWKKAVECLLIPKRTAKLGIKVREAGLIFVCRNGPRDWAFVVKPMGIIKPYREIAGHLRETHGIPTGFKFSQDGSVELTDGDVQQKLEVAMLPIGLVVVGETPENLWSSEVALPAAKLFAQIAGQNETEMTRAFYEQALAWASERIRDLSGQSRQAADLVRNIDTDETHLFPGRDEPGEFER